MAMAGRLARRQFLRQRLRQSTGSDAELRPRSVGLGRLERVERSMVHNPSYIHVRHDLLGLRPENWTSALDVGCATGVNGAALKHEHRERLVVGIELDQSMSEDAAKVLDRVIQGDAVAGLETLLREGESFDLVICGDVLEHLADPWHALRLIRELCPKGAVLVSLPNVAHISTIMSLLFWGRWPYRDRGIHDRTHLRFFGRSNLPELFRAGGFYCEEMRTRHRLRERKGLRRMEAIVSRLPIVRQLTTFQFLCRLRAIQDA